MRFVNDRERRAAFFKMNNNISDPQRPVGADLKDYTVPDWVSSSPSKEIAAVDKLAEADYLLKFRDDNKSMISGDASTIGLSGVPVELTVNTDKKKLKDMDKVLYNLDSQKPQSDLPDYNLETWQKNIAGVPKYKIDQYYREIWDKLEPQLKDHNILVRYTYDHKPIVKRHEHGKATYTTIDSPEKLSEIVKEHGVEIWDETSKKGNLGRADLAVLDIDNLDDVSERKMKEVTKSVYEDMNKSFNTKPYIINTHGGYHVGVKLDKPIPYKTLRNKVDKEVISPVESDYPGLASKRHGKTPIFLDKTPIKTHGSTKAIGSLNLPDLTITEKIPIDELDSFRRHRLT